MSAVETRRIPGSAVSEPTEVTGTPGRRRAKATGATSRRRRRYLRESAPWQRSDVTRAGVLVFLGAAVGVWSWFGVSGSVRLRDQQGWAAVACLGAAIAACGGVYLVTVAMREVRLGQRQLLFDLADVLGWSVTVTKRGRVQVQADPGSAGDEPTALTDVSARILVIGPGMTVAHRGDCPIARGKATSPISDDGVATRGLGTCGICHSGTAALGEAV